MKYTKRGVSTALRPGLRATVIASLEMATAVWCHTVIALERPFSILW
jgi:hypothetical protein